MTARYPSNAIQFDYRANVTDLIQAQDVNVLYDEVIAIGNTTIGTTPLTSATWGATATLSTSTSWASLKDRIQNLENGTFASYNYRVSTQGGSTLTPSGTDVVGLIVRATAGQTADLVRAQSSDGTTVTKVDKDGVLYYNNAVVATRTGTETLTNKTLSSATISGSTNTVTNLAPTSVIVSGTTNIQQYVDAKPTTYYVGTQPSSPKAGDIWVDSTSTTTTFDTTSYLSNSSPSVTSGFGYHRITASTSAPLSTDGANGDIWLQYV